MQLLIAAHERDCAVAVHNGSAAVVAETCTFLKNLYLKGPTVSTCFIATPPGRGWQHNEGLLLLHSFLSLDI